MKFNFSPLIPKWFVCCLFMAFFISANAAVDPNFYIYICFGQSNMEGNAAIAEADRQNVNPRFKMMAVCDGTYSGQQRKAGNWYTAVPPLCRQNTGLTPADYFGRVLVDSLPSNIRIGIVMVAIGGASIDAFDPVAYKAYYDSSVDWLKGIMNSYGGTPYATLIKMAKKAQQSGVIKGILLHQGETNNGQTDWPGKVKKIYDDMMTDLNLNPDSVPLLAGEMRYQNQGGICWGMNSIIDDLPRTIKNCYVISADGCQGNTVDGFHFSTEGARELGRRYGYQMYALQKTYATVEGRRVDHLTMDTTSYTMLTGSYIPLVLKAVYLDGHVKDVARTATFVASDTAVAKVVNGFLEARRDGTTQITATYKDEEGVDAQVSFTVTATSFPLTSDLFNPSIYGTGTFNESTLSLTTGQYGFGGWKYAGGLDLSAYKYLVVRLATPQSCGAVFRLFDENNYWASASEVAFGSNTKVVVNLQTMKKTVNGTSVACDASHIYLMGFWSYGGSPIKIKDIFLSNDGTNPLTTDVRPLAVGQAQESDAVYTLSGMRVKSGTDLGRLPKGVYISRGKCVLVN
jgi:hypothetical protein